MIIFEDMREADGDRDDKKTNKKQRPSDQPQYTLAKMFHLDP